MRVLREAQLHRKLAYESAHNRANDSDPAFQRHLIGWWTGGRLLRKRTHCTCTSHRTTPVQIERLLRSLLALAHAILVSLMGSLYTGYNLVKQFDGSVGFFWKASHQQIYHELAKLEAQGWVSAETIPQEGRPDKKLYQVTELGHKQLVEWIARSCEPMPTKDELLI